MLFISVHIPKTAGTSLAHVLDHGTDRKIFYDYRSDYTNVRFSPAEKRQFMAAMPFVRNTFRFIHGHFYLQKYAELMPDAKSMACFREPIARIISQYNHVAMEQNEASAAYRRIKEGMDIVDFAMDVNVANAHRVHLGDVPPERIDAILMSEDLDRGLKFFRTTFPGVIVNGWADVPMRNTKTQRAKASDLGIPKVTDAQIEKVKHVARDEIAYCEAARKVYEARLRSGSV